MQWCLCTVVGNSKSSLTDCIHVLYNQTFVLFQNYLGNLCNRSTMNQQMDWQTDRYKIIFICSFCVIVEECISPVSGLLKELCFVLASDSVNYCRKIDIWDKQVLTTRFTTHPKSVTGMTLRWCLPAYSFLVPWNCFLENNDEDKEHHRGNSGLTQLIGFKFSGRCCSNMMEV